MTIYNGNTKCERPAMPCPPFPPFPPEPPIPPIPPVPRYIVGPQGPQGPMGPQGIQGPIGLTGPQGPQGPAGPSAVSAYAGFYALEPTDNPTAIAPGGAVAFPNTTTASAGISQTSPTTFTLATPGVYMVTFDATTDAGQLQITLNGTPLAYTTVGKTTTGDQLRSTAIIPTNTPNSTISVINPANATTSVTLTPSAGGANPVAAHLDIVKIA